MMHAAVILFPGGKPFDGDLDDALFELGHAGDVLVLGELAIGFGEILFFSGAAVLEFVELELPCLRGSDLVDEDARHARLEGLAVVLGDKTPPFDEGPADVADVGPHFARVPPRRRRLCEVVELQELLLDGVRDRRREGQRMSKSIRFEAAAPPADGGVLPLFGRLLLLVVGNVCCCRLRGPAAAADRGKGELGNFDQRQGHEKDHRQDEEVCGLHRRGLRRALGFAGPGALIPGARHARGPPVPDNFKAGRLAVLVVAGVFLRVRNVLLDRKGAREEHHLDTDAQRPHRPTMRRRLEVHVVEVREGVVHEQRLPKPSELAPGF
mmetsp:Transcript_13934/g.45481  ORF Transcript_13934/g.45481 Transcript_13934/m.45481 type:complete len:324 (+) Transcript_13934:2811-3782(+)